MSPFLLFACIGTLSSVLALADVVIIPHVVTGMDPASQLDYFTQVHIVDLSGVDAAIGKVTVFSSQGSGAPVFPTGMPVTPAVPVKTFAIAPKGEATIEIPLWGSLGVFWVKVESSSVVGVVVTLQAKERTSSHDLVTSTSVIPVPPAQRFTAPAFISQDTNTGLAICNPSETENAKIAVKLHDKGGDVVQQRTITLEPLHKMTQLLTEDGLFPGITEFEGSLEVESVVPITIVVVRVDQTYWSSFPAFTE